MQNSTGCVDSQRSERPDVNAVHLLHSHYHPQWNNISAIVSCLHIFALSPKETFANFGRVIRVRDSILINYGCCDCLDTSVTFVYGSQMAF